ncbi:MAG: hypothetical protein AB7G17_12550 [Phycisphaerales bacterium]
MKIVFAALLMTVCALSVAQPKSDSPRDAQNEIKRLLQENQQLREENDRLRQALAVLGRSPESLPPSRTPERAVRLRLVSVEQSPLTPEEAADYVSKTGARRDQRLQALADRLVVARSELAQLRTRKTRMVQDNEAAKHSPRGGTAPHSGDAMQKIEHQITEIQNEVAAINREVAYLRKQPIQEEPAAIEIPPTIVRAVDENGNAFRVTMPHPNDAFFLAMLPGDWFEVRGRVTTTTTTHAELAQWSEFLASSGDRLRMVPADH